MPAYCVTRCRCVYDVHDKLEKALSRGLKSVISSILATHKTGIEVEPDRGGRIGQRAVSQQYMLACEPIDVEDPLRT